MIAIPRGDQAERVISETDDKASDATFHLYVRDSKHKHGQLVWAKSVKPVTFELTAAPTDG